MKLKQTPDDFQVEELTAVVPTAGPFALYRLEKRSWTTPDALAAVRRRWKIADHRAVSYGGLKDRHAATIQQFTIFHGPQRNLTHHDVNVTYLGRVPRPYTSADIIANRFRLVLRALTQSELSAALAAADVVKNDGVPNYYDDQRFGSAGSGEFIARLMVVGQYEEALKLALAGPYEFDKAPAKKEKASLLRLWGQWPQCKAALDRGHARSLVDYLVQHPTDFRGAVARLRPELHGLYLSAYQSFLWNRMLAALIAQVVSEDRCVPLRLKLGDMPAPRQLTDDERAKLTTDLPLPSARLKMDAAAPWAPLVTAALADQGFELAKMKLPGLQQPFFSKGERPTWLTPSNFNATALADDRHAGRHRLDLSFDLPRGSYATIIVKRLTQPAIAASDP